MFDQFVPIDGIHINGRLTLGENIAELGGLELALAALEDVMRRHPATERYAFTEAQQFFLVTPKAGA